MVIAPKMKYKHFLNKYIYVFMIYSLDQKAGGLQFLVSVLFLFCLHPNDENFDIYPFSLLFYFSLNSLNPKIVEVLRTQERKKKRLQIFHSPFLSWKASAVKDSRKIKIFIFSVKFLLF